MFTLKTQLTKFNENIGDKHWKHFSWKHNRQNMMKTQQINIKMLKRHRFVSNKPKSKPQFFSKLQCEIKDCLVESWKSWPKPTTLIHDSIHHFQLNTCNIDYIHWYFPITRKCNISGIQTANSWIIWLVFVDEYQLVHIFNLEMTSMKCNQMLAAKK
jgi:hypothetical protein